MVGDIKIKENRELLARIVAEKGFFGYKWQHHEIWERIITPETTYEGLSDENREILYDVTGLD